VAPDACPSAAAHAAAQKDDSALHPGSSVAANNFAPFLPVLRPKADASAAPVAARSAVHFPAWFPAPDRDCPSAAVRDFLSATAAAPALPDVLPQPQVPQTLVPQPSDDFR
jgi:hypothetical protein